MTDDTMERAHRRYSAHKRRCQDLLEALRAFQAVDDAISPSARLAAAITETETAATTDSDRVVGAWN